MVSMKRSIAALIVCFKPHVLLTLCILLVIAHSIVITIQKGAGSSWRLGKQYDLTITMTTLVLIVALIWAAFFIFIVRFELRNELESLLVLFQCSKRGLRFLGVVGFHVGLLGLIALLVSLAVEKSLTPDAGHELSYENSTQHHQLAGKRPIADEEFNGATRRDLGVRRLAQASDTMEVIFEDDEDGFLETATAQQRRRGRLAVDGKLQLRSPPPVGGRNNRRLVLDPRKSKLDRAYLMTVYKIWLTAIVYAFSYLVIENVIMFYADMSLIEFVHDSFLMLVARLTGIDLSDYPAGEMLFNPLVRHRIR